MSVPLAALFRTVFTTPRNIGRICEIFGEIPNIEFPTMGGEVFWDTLASEGGYKLQRNVFTGHCRILDSEDIRIAWGAERSLRRRLESIA